MKKDNSTFANKHKVKDAFDDVKDFEQLLDDAENNSATKWEMDYVADLKERYDIYGKDTFINIAQLDKLREIANQ